MVYLERLPEQRCSQGEGSHHGDLQRRTWAWTEMRRSLRWLGETFPLTFWNAISPRKISFPSVRGPKGTYLQNHQESCYKNMDSWTPSLTYQIITWEAWAWKASNEPSWWTSCRLKWEPLPQTTAQAPSQTFIHSINITVYLHVLSLELGDK